MIARRGKEAGFCTPFVLRGGACPLKSFSGGGGGGFSTPGGGGGGAL